MININGLRFFRISKTRKIWRNATPTWETPSLSSKADLAWLSKAYSIELQLDYSFWVTAMIALSFIESFSLIKKAILYCMLRWWRTSYRPVKVSSLQVQEEWFSGTEKEQAVLLALRSGRRHKLPNHYKISGMVSSL